MVIKSNGRRALHGWDRTGRAVWGKWVIWFASSKGFLQSMFRLNSERCGQLQRVSKYLIKVTHNYSGERRFPRRSRKWQGASESPSFLCSSTQNAGINYGGKWRYAELHSQLWKWSQASLLGHYSRRQCFLMNYSVLSFNSPFISYKLFNINGFSQQNLILSLKKKTNARY